MGPLKTLSAEQSINLHEGAVFRVAEAETHPAVQGVQDQRDAHKVVGRVYRQVFLELPDVGVHLHQQPSLPNPEMTT